MISRWRWLYMLLTRRLWFRSGLYGVAAIVTALIAAFASPFIPEDLPDLFGAEAVGDILKIIATSMLAVATFSLGTMVSAFAFASSTATPRASQLLIEDSTSQNVVSTFIGAFIFGLVGIIALNTHFYGPGGRAVLFFVTLIVVALVLVTFFRWIDYLSHIGRLSETIEKVEKAAADAMRARWLSPCLDCQPLQSVPSSTVAVNSDKFGYVQHLDVASLARIAEAAGGSVYVKLLPGAFAEAGQPLAFVTWLPNEHGRRELTKAFLIGKVRSFDQDPRFGLIVLSEIASRALSPGVNDPGTAIDIIGRILRILAIWAEDREPRETAIEYSNVFVPAIADSDLFDDAFGPIARDGAGTLEVGIRLQKAFRSLSRLGSAEFREAARSHSALAMQRSVTALQLSEDRAIIERYAAI